MSKLCQIQSHVTTDGQSVCLDVEPLPVIMTRLLLSLWGALSDERSGLLIIRAGIFKSFVSTYISIYISDV
jgi:hypothetical protein